MAINVFEDITEHKQSELRARFLADAATVLASSLDYETTLQQVADLAIPTFADGCIVELADADGHLMPVAMAHRDREKVALMRELRERYPAEQSAPRGSRARLPHRRLRAVRRARSVRRSARACPRTARSSCSRRVGVRSLMVVPMSTGGRRLGHDRVRAVGGPAPLRPRRPVRGRGARAARRGRDRQRPPVPRAQPHRAHAPGEPAAARAARGRGRRGGRPLPPRRRGDRGRRRLLRRLRHRARLERRDGRRVRQGRGRRRRHRARPLHAAGRSACRRPRPPRSCAS